MSQFLYQQKQAWGSLKKKVGFVATVVTTMGTTLGALLCVLTLGYLLILEPLPYPDQDKLYSVVHGIGDKSGETNATAFTYPGLIHLYKNQDVFEKSALIQYGQDVLTSLPNQPTLSTGYATPEWFELLGAKMQMGRIFEATEALLSLQVDFGAIWLLAAFQTPLRHHLNMAVARLSHPSVSLQSFWHVFQTLR